MFCVCFLFCKTIVVSIHLACKFNCQISLWLFRTIKKSIVVFSHLGICVVSSRFISVCIVACQISLEHCMAQFIVVEVFFCFSSSIVLGCLILWKLVQKQHFLHAQDIFSIHSIIDLIHLHRFHFTSIFWSWDRVVWSIFRWSSFIGTSSKPLLERGAFAMIGS